MLEKAHFINGIGDGEQSVNLDLPNPDPDTNRIIQRYNILRGKKRGRHINNHKVGDILNRKEKDAEDLDHSHERKNPPVNGPISIGQRILGRKIILPSRPSRTGTSSDHGHPSNVHEQSSPSEEHFEVPVAAILFILGFFIFFSYNTILGDRNRDAKTKGRMASTMKRNKSAAKGMTRSDSLMIRTKKKTDEWIEDNIEDIEENDRHRLHHHNHNHHNHQTSLTGSPQKGLNNISGHQLYHRSSATMATTEVVGGWKKPNAYHHPNSFGLEGIGDVAASDAPAARELLASSTATNACGVTAANNTKNGTASTIGQHENQIGRSSTAAIDSGVLNDVELDVHDCRSRCSSIDGSIVEDFTKNPSRGASSDYSVSPCRSGISSGDEEDPDPFGQHTPKSYCDIDDDVESPGDFLKPCFSLDASNEDGHRAGGDVGRNHQSYSVDTFSELSLPKLSLGNLPKPPPPLQISNLPPPPPPLLQPEFRQPKPPPPPPLNNAEQRQEEYDIESDNKSSISSGETEGANGVLHKRKNLTSCSDAASSLHSPIPYSELKMKRLIGGGGFGQVCSATWRGTPVAVKILSASSQTENIRKAILQEFAAEINMLSGMRHPNICLYIGACLDPQNRAIVTELAANGSLWDALRLPLKAPYNVSKEGSPSIWPFELYDDNYCAPGGGTGAPPAIAGNAGLRSIITPPQGAWPWALVRRVAEGAARGMNYLHCGHPAVLHRDLKSANILLDDSYSPKVCDFGLSRLKAQENSMTGNCGTVQWMAPEILGNEKYAEPADVFSYGIILWELLQRECPYEGMSSIQCALAVLNNDARPEIPSWCPEAFADLIRMCVGKEPSKRPTFGQILATLDQMPR